MRVWAVGQTFLFISPAAQAATAAPNPIAHHSWIGPIALLAFGLVLGAIAFPVVARLLKLRKRSTIPYEDEERKIFAATIQIASWIGIFALIGVIDVAITCSGLAMQASAVSESAQFFAIFGADLIVAASAGAAGSLFGFLFAIPRTLDSTNRAAVATGSLQAGPTAATSQAMLSANTNLERISDWLTTLLIGATLVQIKDIVGWIASLGKGMAGTGNLTNSSIVPIIVIYFLALGFLGVYLITRLYLTFALRQTLFLLSSAAGASALQELKDKLKAGLVSSAKTDLSSAWRAFSAKKLRPGDEADPELNALVARTLVQLLSSEADKVDPTITSEQLKAAVCRAATDQNFKDQLRSDLEAKKLTTGRSDLDAEITKVLE